jgi:hypothetical protein
VRGSRAGTSTLVTATLRARTPTLDVRLPLAKALARLSTPSLTKALARPRAPSLTKVLARPRAPSPTGALARARTPSLVAAPLAGAPLRGRSSSLVAGAPLRGRSPSPTGTLGRARTGASRAPLAGAFAWPAAPRLAPRRGGLVGTIDLIAEGGGSRAQPSRGAPIAETARLLRARPSSG